ncbi:hypothetical protein ACHAXS_005060 [Conticribra weissflogii]
MEANLPDNINATPPSTRSSELSDHDRTILHSVHSTKRCAPLDSAQNRLGGDIPESFQQSGIKSLTPSWHSLSIDPSMVASSLLFTQSSEENFDQKDTTTSSYPDCLDETLYSNSGLSSKPSSQIDQLPPSTLLAKTVTTKHLIDLEDEIDTNNSDEDADSVQPALFPADSFAAIGRRLMMSGISSESDRFVVNDNPSIQKISLSNRHMNKHWWNRFQTDDDWESLRVYSEEYLNALTSQQMTNSRCVPPIRKCDNPCSFGGERNFQDDRAGRETGDPSGDFLVGLVKDLVSVQEQINKLPPTPPRVPADVELSTRKINHAPETLRIPSHLICHICEEIVIGATLIDCQHCEGSESNGGAVVCCWKCLEESTYLRIDEIKSNEFICPFCNPKCNSIDDVGRSRLTFCRPVPCQALDVAIANTIENVSNRSQENNSDLLSGNLSGIQLVNRYYFRLEDWRTETTGRRLALERELFACRERILAAIVDAEERQFWRPPNRERNISSHEEEKDHSDSSLLGSENDGYFNVIDRESSTWDELGEEVAAGLSKCSILPVHTTFVAAATSIVAIFLAMQTRRN